MVDPVKLDAAEVVTIPAATEKVYDKMWITEIHIMTPEPTAEGSIALHYLPMSAEGELFDSVFSPQQRILRLDNLFESLKQIPELAAAYVAFVAAVEPVKKFIKQ